MNKPFKQGPLSNLVNSLKVRTKYKLIIYFSDVYEIPHFKSQCRGNALKHKVEHFKCQLMQAKKSYFL